MILDSLITENTPILDLPPNEQISGKLRYKILNLKCLSAKKYIKYLHYFNNLWYYFKSEERSNMRYPYCISDELIGSYLASLRNLPTVNYQISKVCNELGIASVNFKEKGIKYFNLSDMIGNHSYYGNPVNVEILKSFTINSENEEDFMKKLFDLLAIDIHMLQTDRCNLNFQFYVDKNNYINFAPLYDYSNCLPSVGNRDINLSNHIIDLNFKNIKYLLDNYPKFKESLEECLDYSMEDIWDQICKDYNFNQDCATYERIREYYEIKDNNQQQYIKKLLKN